MRALVCPRLGTPDVLDLVELPDPVPGQGEIVVAVSHVGLNFHDTLVIAGTHVVKPDPPFSPGSEYAGVVSAIGPGVHTVSIGDRVVGNEEYGCAREAVVVRADRVTRIPDGVSQRDAAAVLVAYSTAYHALVQRADLRPGETLVVLGAGGGVGSAAVDVGKLLGAKVIAAASARDRAETALARGADDCFSYGGEPVKEAIRDRTGGAGADVIFDPIGGPVAESAVRALRWQGRHLVVGFATGKIPRIAFNIPLVKGASVVGVFLGEFIRRDRATHEENLRRIFDWVIERRLQPLVHGVVPLADGPDALRLLAAGQARGKLLLHAIGSGTP
ncbi:NADPH:quinone oxidoreductase family protein [Kribbella sp. NPDC004875]|uniref:NADPH:quinone oxidoreductase family protein n=1 Tax=Kribbella sp. NPDC004875 TaxID=3364107 RepID=UPI0036751EAE